MPAKAPPASDRGRQPKRQDRKSEATRLRRIRERLWGTGRRTLSADARARLQEEAVLLETAPERFTSLSAELNRNGLNLPFALNAEQVSIVADALIFAAQHTNLKEQLEECWQRQSHASVALIEFLPKRWPPPDGLSETESQAWVRRNQISMQERFRIVTNRLLGLPDGHSFRPQRDAAALKQDWEDLCAGRPNPRFPTRTHCGLPLPEDQRCPQHDGTDCVDCHKRMQEGFRHCQQHGYHGWCATCQRQWRPIGPLKPQEAFEAIQSVHRFPTPAACYKALNRAGVKLKGLGLLPSTWGDAY